jgi:uncharacterized repeat protein (TIGR01451 family)
MSRARRRAAVSVSLLLVLSLAGPYSTSADHGGDQGVNPQGWEGILTQVTSDPEFTHSETGSIVWHLNGPDAPVTADVNLETDNLVSTGSLCHGWVKRSFHEDGLPAAPNLSLTVYRLTDGQRAGEPLGPEGGDYYLSGALGVSVDAETTLYYVPQGPGADCPAPIVSTELIGLISNVGFSAQTYTAEPGWTTLTGTYEFNNGGTWSGSENFALSPNADLAVTKVGLPEELLAGDEATFTMIVSNNGPAASANVVLNDTISGPNWSLVNLTTSQGTCGQVASTGFQCDLGTLASGESAGISLAVTGEAGTLVNTATVSGDTPDPISENNSGSDSVVFQALAPGGVDCAKTVVVVAAVFGHHKNPKALNDCVVWRRVVSKKVFANGGDTDGLNCFRTKDSRYWTWDEVRVAHAAPQDVNGIQQCSSAVKKAEGGYVLYGRQDGTWALDGHTPSAATTPFHRLLELYTGAAPDSDAYEQWRDVYRDQGGYLGMIDIVKGRDMLASLCSDSISDHGTITIGVYTGTNETDAAGWDSVIADITPVLNGCAS